jgi:sialate O-acetylesterase
LITDWRSHFANKDLPFYIVQLANWTKRNTEPCEHPWAELREAQWLTAKNVPHCGIATAVDIGDEQDIHPKNKLEVGRRLALAALAQTYGRKIEFSGPTYKKSQINDNTIRLAFDHLGGGLVMKGDKLAGFAIAGDDKKFVWGEARIEGDTVLVTNPTVPHPVAVRYAWDANPATTLYNKKGLPALPFRTDDWPSSTLNNK